ELPQNNEPLVKEEEQDKLINEYLSKEEVEDLMKEGFSKDQIAYVAREKEKGERQWKILEKILDILPWIP
ncbi:hypothetical protein WKT02_12745, partial [Erysipelotrichaceae bacterium HCN-30851]